MRRQVKEWGEYIDNGVSTEFILKAFVDSQEFLLIITVQMYPCSEGTDTGSPAL